MGLFAAPQLSLSRHREAQAEEEERRRYSGALEDSKPQTSMLEKLLRSAHGLERRKGFGKGKFEKGKGKGKFGKGKFDKGKGKGKGGKGKGKGKDKHWWNGSSTWNGDEWRDLTGMHEVAPVVCEHISKALPLPSVLANCVPLEAPFGAAPLHQQAPMPMRGRLCKYFSQGFCYHGAKCQYDHGDQPGTLALEDSQATASGQRYWTLPSTLANRVCGLGEGPAAYHGVPQRPRGPRYEAPEPPEDRPRRDGLLRRLLQADVDRYYSAILQCVRYIVATDFFRLEKVPPPPCAQVAAAPSSASQPSASSSSASGKDLEAASRAIAGVAAGAFAGVPRVELGDEELLELAKVLEV